MQEIKIDSKQDISSIFDKKPDKITMEDVKNIFKNKRTRRIFIFLVIVSVSIICLLVFLTKRAMMPEFAYGNLNCKGKVAYDGKYTYIALDDGVYKEYKNTLTKLSNDKAFSLFIDDEYLYYLSLFSQNNYDIKRMNLESEEVGTIKKIYTNDNKFFYYNGYCYYISSENGNGIRKVSVEDMNESLIEISNIIDFSVNDGKMYFTDTMGELVSVNLDNSSERKVLDEEHNIKNIQVVKKWIYFYDNKSSALCKIKIDGSDFQEVNKNISNDYYNITNKGNIYYYDGEKSKICRSSLKGDNVKELIDIKNSKTAINILNRKIYFDDYESNESTLLKLYVRKDNGKPTAEWNIKAEEESPAETIEEENVEKKTENTIDEEEPEEEDYSEKVTLKKSINKDESENTTTDENTIDENTVKEVVKIENTNEKNEE